MSEVCNTLAILVISSDDDVRLSVARALQSLSCEKVSVACQMKNELISPTGSADLILQKVQRAAISFLNSQKRVTHIVLVCADSFETAVHSLASYSTHVTLGVCIVDSRTISKRRHTPAQLEPLINQFFENIENSKIAFLRMPDSVMVLIPPADFLAYPNQGTTAYRVRVLPVELSHLEAEIISVTVTYIQLGYANQIALRKGRLGHKPNAMGDSLASIMHTVFGREWVLSYYTGSIISSLIKTVEARASASGAIIVRGPNEHALACNSFINWRLYRRGFLTILTSAMLDELKGTLANLQQSKARGIVICADATTAKRFGFQATINSDADIRKVLAARHLPFVYIETIEELYDAMDQVLRLLDNHDGPIVIVATQSVLEVSLNGISRHASTQRILLTKTQSSVSHAVSQMERALQIINFEKTHIIWQCGALSDEEKDLALDVSARAGIALSDSLSAPGFMPSYHNGCRVKNYIGMLGQYGTNQNLYEYLQTGSTLNPLTEQCLFILKGKFGQIDSPFSDADHKNRLRIIHINKQAEHIAPYAEIAIQLPVMEFLQFVRERVQVSPDILRFRTEKISTILQNSSDVLSEIPTLPMHPSYFFRSLSNVVCSLIESDEYRYTGLFDVGHAGTLAVRWLPRTNPSYSGWYGRGLMGDALMSAAALVTTGKDNVIAVIGDGAKHMVPDIIPSILENLQNTGGSISKNVTIFFILNNALSIINTYQERMMYQKGGRQMVIVNDEQFVDHDVEVVFAGTRIIRRRLTEFDTSYLRNALQQQNQINLFNVTLCVSNDGVLRTDADSWQYRS